MEDSYMPQIRPISDLRNKFAEISQIVHNSREPVFLTKNGYGDMVVMSIEEYETQKFRADINTKLAEAEIEAATTKTRYTQDEAIKMLRAKLDSKRV